MTGPGPGPELDKYHKQAERLKSRERRAKVNMLDG